MSTPNKIAILVPDGAYPLVLGEILKRNRSLGIRVVAHDFIKDALRDSSPESAELLRPSQRECTHALIVRDLHGSGWETKGAAALEEHLRSQLQDSGWPPERSDALVVDPEIEAWLRFDSAHFQDMLRDRARRRRDEDLLLKPVIEEIIASQGGFNQWGKPLNPKESFEEALRTFGIQRSNALYQHLASRESLKNCVIPSFNQLVSILQNWFPLES